MTRRRTVLGTGVALVTVALADPLLASWVVPGGGGATSTAAVLGTPAGLTARAVGTGSVTLSWTPPSGAAPDAYVVRRDGRVVDSCGPRTATGCTDAGLAEGTTYRYTVTAGLGRWTGSPSAPVAVRTEAADTTPPTVVHVARTDGSPTAQASVGWTVTFSEPVTGFDVADLALTPALTGARLTSVTGSGVAWTVRASTGSQSGTLGLELVDDDTVVDAALNPLGGPGTGSAAGPAYEVDRAAPTVTVDQAAGQADPTDTAPLRWAVVFSERVTGFDADDLVLTGGTGGGLSVSGTGRAYEVALAGPLTDGTARLDVSAGAATDVVGHSSAASTSGDSSITYAAGPLEGAGPVEGESPAVGAGPATSPLGSPVIQVSPTP